MTTDIEYAPFEASFDGPAPSAPSVSGAPDAPETDLERLHEVPVELTVEIGRTRMTIGETLQLGPGSIVSLSKLAGDPVDLLVNGKPIARGEVVVIDEEFGLRLTELLSPESEKRQSRSDMPDFTASL